MIDKDYNNPIHHYQNILELRGHQHAIYNRKVERLAAVRNRPNPMSILMTYAEYVEYRKKNDSVVDVTV